MMVFLFQGAVPIRGEVSTEQRLIQRKCWLLISGGILARFGLGCSSVHFTQLERKDQTSEQNINIFSVLGSNLPMGWGPFSETIKISSIFSVR
jgi:hypothetical protein